MIVYDIRKKGNKVDSLHRPLPPPEKNASAREFGVEGVYSGTLCSTFFRTNRAADRLPIRQPQVADYVGGTSPDDDDVL